MEAVTSMQSVEGKNNNKNSNTNNNLISSSGEVVNFPKTVRPRGVVEQWLTAVEQAMYDAVKHHLKVRLKKLENLFPFFFI